MVYLGTQLYCRDV